MVPGPEFFADFTVKLVEVHIVVKAADIASSSAFEDRAFVFLKYVLIFDHIISIGLKSELLWRKI